MKEGTSALWTGVEVTSGLSWGRHLWAGVKEAGRHIWADVEEGTSGLAWRRAPLGWRGGGCLWTGVEEGTSGLACGRAPLGWRVVGHLWAVVGEAPLGWREGSWKAHLG